MAGSNWQQLAGGSVNPYDIRRDDGTPTADYGEHIISDGGTVTLPSPKADKAVLVSNISQDTTVTTSTGLVEQQSDVTHLSSVSDPVLFVSDGSDWYVANNLDYLSSIPDAGLQHRFETETLLLADGNDITSVSNQVSGANDLSSGTDAPTYRTDQFNGYPVARFDGVDDQLLTSISNLSQPLQIWWLGQYQSTGGYAFDGGSDFENSILQNNGNWQTNDSSPSAVSDGTSDTNKRLVDVKATSSNIEITVHNKGSGSSNNGGQTLTGLTLGSRSVDAGYSQSDMVALFVYDTSESGYSESDVRDAILDKYGDGSSL